MRERLLWPCLAVGLVLAVIAPQIAEAARKVVVMRADGKVDAFTRKALEYKLLEVARRVDPKATQVDFVFADAAAVSDCKGDVETCKDRVLDEFGVDDVLVATAEPGPGGTVVVTVRHARRGRAMQTTTYSTTASTLDADTVAKVGPWFGAAPKATALDPVKPVPPGTKPTPTPTPAPAITRDVPDDEPPPPVASDAPPAPAPTTEPAPAPSPISTSTERSDTGSGSGGRRTLYLGGAIGGGVLALVGVALWAQASSTQSDIDAAPIATANDLRNLQDLEANGKSYARWGNVAVVGGVALGAVCGVLYWRSRRDESRTVAIAPLLAPHTAGVTLSVGGF